MNRTAHALARLGRPLLLLSMSLGCLFPSTSALAAEASSSELDYPLVVFNVASLQRLRDHAGLMFDSAERNDMTDVVDRWMVETLKETKGIDRTRSFGIMMYLNTESFIRPIGISYLPVTDLDETLQTLAYGTGTISPVDGKANQHEIRYNENFKLRTIYRNHYLFLVGPDGNDSSLDFNFPDPEKLTSRLSAQYDVAVSCLIKSIPIGLKTVALEAVKNQLLAELQQRDDEPESAYRLRRAAGEGWVDLLDKVINQGEEFTIGARLDPDTRVGRIDIELAGTSDSKFAKFFQKMAGKRTYFGNLLDNPATFSVSSSWQLEEKQRKLVMTYLEAAERDIAKNAEQDDTTDLVKIVDPLFKTLITTADVGHLDAFAQLTGAAQGNFVLVGGAKLATSRNLPAQIAELLEYIKENPKDNEWPMNLELSSDSIDSLPVHRLPINPPDAAGQRMFGEAAYLYFYSSPQAVWCAFGGDAALDTLRDAVASSALPQTPQQARNRVPFQFITHAQNWLSVSDPDNPNAVSLNERAQASFDSDNDAMTIEVRPTDRGLRLRTEFQSGFLSLMGRGFTNGIENGFGRPRERTQRDPVQPNPGVESPQPPQ